MTPTRQDVALAAAAFAAGLVLLAGGAYTHRGAVAALFVLPLAVTCLGVVLRRRAPVLALVLGGVALIGDVLLGPSLGTVLIVTDNIYAGVLYGPRPLGRIMLWITSVGAVVLGALTGLAIQDWRVLTVVGIQAALVGVVPVTTAIVVRQHRDQAVAERARADQMAHLAELDRQAAVSAERTRMARELHDMIANHFSAIAIQSSAMLARADLDAAATRKIVESIRENSVQGMAEMRTMIGFLRQDGEEIEARRHRLSDVKALIERTGFPVELSVRGTPRDLPAAVDLAGYRILQESFTNVLKHGTDRGARVLVDYRPDLVSLTVLSDVGDRPSGLPGAGAGLVGMRERATLLGGRFEAGPYESGWRVRVELPTDSGEPSGLSWPPARTRTAEPGEGTPSKPSNSLRDGELS
ncbi:histidine kinase [Microtetraspora sp. NBRC 16547]|uniref:sensor histidine kinase n=1 Tax=Microtetraspora sp. NBRC 16547 TaxID=3030993 RepID=UPI0024A1083A|nr:histidine kinase [Microtetraspora sp. NBRC 16547]GLW99989.1 two-component sensor histidine kinase [Microtetraspora sp. NBRC 16547]